MGAKATNTFDGGLNKDINSLITPSNVLTDALNATILTYLGDDFILLQDFGNGRVETAYLPRGYVPVGIKEYAGIIYIACYNPQNGLCLLGSFPSPERNISSDELSPLDLELKINLQDTTLFTSILELFLGNNIMRPGDKFSINIDFNNDFADWVMRWGDDTNDINLIKLDIGIKTSDGNTVIITDQLKKVIQEDQNLKYNQQDGKGHISTNTATENDSVPNDLYFYITEKLDEKSNLPQLTGFWASSVDTSSITNPDEYRKLTNNNYLNIFNNKLSGELVLISELPSIESFSLTNSTSISGETYSTTYYPEVLFSDVREINWFGGIMFLQEYLATLDLTATKQFEDLLSGETTPSSSLYNLVVYYATRVEKKDVPNSPGHKYYFVYMTFGTDNESYNNKENISEKTTNTLRLNEVIDAVYLVNSDFNYSNYNVDIDGNFDEWILNNKFTIKMSYTTSNDIGYLHYIARPFMKFTSLKTYQIEGDIDLSLVNSGIFLIDKWQWYTDVDKGEFTLRWKLKAYATEEFYFDLVAFAFFPFSEYMSAIGIDYNKWYLTTTVEEDNEITIFSESSGTPSSSPIPIDQASLIWYSGRKESFNGTFIETFYSSLLNMLDLYAVQIYIRLNKANTESKYTNFWEKNHTAQLVDGTELDGFRLLETKTIVTTEMFNEEYISSSESDFSILAQNPIDFTVNINLPEPIIDSTRTATNESEYLRYYKDKIENVKINYKTEYIYRNKIFSSIVLNHQKNYLNYDFTGELILNTTDLSIDNVIINPPALNISMNDDEKILIIGNNIIISFSVEESFSGNFNNPDKIEERKFTPYFKSHYTLIYLCNKDLNLDSILYFVGRINGKNSRSYADYYIKSTSVTLYNYIDITKGITIATTSYSTKDSNTNYVLVDRPDEKADSDELYYNNIRTLFDKVIEDGQFENVTVIPLFFIGSNVGNVHKDDARFISAIRTGSGGDINTNTCNILLWKDYNARNVYILDNIFCKHTSPNKEYKSPTLGGLNVFGYLCNLYTYSSSLEINEVEVFLLDTSIFISYNITFELHISKSIKNIKINNIPLDTFNSHILFFLELFDYTENLFYLYKDSDEEIISLISIDNKDYSNELINFLDIDSIYVLELKSLDSKGEKLDPSKVYLYYENNIFDLQGESSKDSLDLSLLKHIQLLDGYLTLSPLNILDSTGWSGRDTYYDSECCYAINDNASIGWSLRNGGGIIKESFIGNIDTKRILK